MSAFAKGVLVGVAGTLVVTGLAVAVGGKLVWDGLRLAKQAIGAEAAEASETKTFPIQGLRKISVSTGVGDVTVEAADVPAVQVTVRRVAKADTLKAAQERLKEVQWSAQVYRGVLVLRQDTDNRRDEMGRELHFTVRVPKKASLRTRARTGIGALTLTGLNGPTTGEAGVGDVHARDLGGNLNLESGTGDVIVEGGHGPLKAEAGVGAVRVHGRKDALDLKTGTGDIEADVAALAAPAELETGIGNIVLTTTRKGDVKFDLHAGIGQVKNGIASAKPAPGKAQDETILVLGKGKHLVSATTGTGDIRIVPAD